VGQLIRSAVLSAVVLAVGAMGSQVRAASLDLTSGYPDATSETIGITYTASNGKFSANGYTTRLRPTPDLLQYVSPYGSFTLNTTFNVTGTGSSEVVTPAGDALLIVTDGSGNTLFTSKELQEFGFNFAGTPGVSGGSWTFEFLFGPGGGDYGSLNSIGVTMSGITLISGDDPDFKYDFTNIVPSEYGAFGTAYSDTFAVPVPLPKASYAGLGTLALVGLFCRRRLAAKAS
jgi:hypothetical protein